MAQSGSRWIGIISFIVSAAALAYGIYYFVVGRPKHGLLGAAVFVVLFIIGLVLVRSRPGSASTAPTKGA